MGTVWAAEDETLHRRVAVKVLNEGLSSDDRFTERFRREARAAASLSHPNIAGVFDYGEEDGRPYLVMERIDGETLADRMQRLGPFEEGEAVRIGAAMAHMHDRPLSLAEARPGTSLELADAVHACLAKEPLRRPSPGSLATMLRAAGLATPVAPTIPVPAAAERTDVLPGIAPIGVAARGTGTSGAGENGAGIERGHARSTPWKRALGIRRPLGSMDPERPRRQRRARWLVGAF